MNVKRTLRQVAVALTLIVAFLFQGTWALAGTTGGLSGTVTTNANAPIAGATVKVVSASQTSSTTTDAAGHFVFLSLTPDTYSVSVQKDGYLGTSTPGVTVFADQTQTLAFQLSNPKEIAKTTSVASSALVRGGTTSDVYSVNSTTATKVTGLGGGGGLDNAYSAIATVPGAFVPVGQAGWFQNVYIRGGDYDQVGYEVDGVPVNRSFDNYPSNTQSALGQQEVQVYTGASPSNAEGQGLAGFINQVIKTGTYPGFADSDLGIGAPIFYHKANIEVGGSTPDRRFSYYAGFGGYNQDYRDFDQNNGASISGNYGAPIDWTVPAGATAANIPALTGGSCAGLAGADNYDLCYAASGGLFPSFGPGGYLLGGFNYASTAMIADRENVMNFHFAIPHKNNSGRDDLQLLYQASHLVTSFYNSPADAFGSTAAAFAADSTNTFESLVGGNIATPAYIGGNTYNGALGQPYVNGSTSPYYYPSQPAGTAYNGALPNTLRDSTQNDVGIVKVQYQKNFSSSAYLRAYGYTVYSDWLLYGPQTTNANFVGPNPSDYELDAHTRGVSATLADQLNSENLLQLQGSYTMSNAIRDNNTTMNNGARTLAALVSSANPYNGICYGAPVAGVAQVPTACSSTQGGTPEVITFAQAATTGFNGAAPAGSTCSGAPCEYLALENGEHATYNAVTPKFTSGSLTDEFDPNDKLHINLGLRYDRFEFDPQGTDTGVARDTWFNSWNNAMCVANVPGSNPVSIAGNAAYGPNDNASTGLCSSLNAGGVTYSQALLTNNPETQTFDVVQPRVAATFTVNPQNVLRFSYGKYDQAPNSAFEEYNTSQQDLPDVLGPTFYAYGRTSPTYPIRPEVSYNTDFSWEHQFKNSDVSFKLTPFYRKTQDQVEQFYLNEKTAFVSGLNVGAQTSSGVEFELQKGDFAKNGFAALLSYTYTYASIKYNPLSTGGSIISPINGSISGYNAYTSACAAGGADVGKSQYGTPLCGTNVNAAGVSNVASPCFTTAGTASACAAGTVANPYYNMNAQGFLDPNGSYAPYDLFPAGLGSGSYSSFVSPNVATLVLNYKHDKFAITPAVQFQTGERYGFPIATEGFEPNTCTGVLASSVTGDPRYGAGAVGGNPADATTCAGAVAIPNPDTGTFDNIGAFINPSRLTASTQFSYDLSPRVTSVLTLTNLVDTCFGGTKGAWTSAVGVSQSKICGYGAGGIGGEIAPVGNFYNPGATVAPFVAHSYSPAFGSLPFNAYLDFKIKI